MTTENQQPVEDQVVQDQQDQEQEVVKPNVPDELSFEEQEYNEDIPETGVKVFDDVGALLREKKVTGASKLIKELKETGELSLSSQATLVEGVGESMARIILDQVNAEVGAAKEAGKAERSRLMQYAADAFGETDLEGTWNGIQEFAKSEEAGLSNQDLQAMNKMLSAGGMQAELVIDRMKALYEKSSWYTESADLVDGDTGGPKGTKPMTRDEYTKQLSELVSKHGYDSPQVEALQRARIRSKQQGL